MKFYATVSYGEIRPYMPPVPYLLPASSWARGNFKPPKLPEHVTDVAADCGGFVATFKWGDYRYTPEQYVEWLYTFNPSWAAMMDWCCEDEITSGNTGIVRERQHRTTEMAWHFWETYRDVPWTWVPTIQGWQTREYRLHAREMWMIVTRMKAFYGLDSEFRVGIGTLCRRADVPTILDVVQTVTDELPSTPLHLWGVKLGAMKSSIALPPSVTSVDSAAWNGLFGKGREEWKSTGMKQQEWVFKVALPRYLDKVSRALDAPKQVGMGLIEEVA